MRLAVLADIHGNLPALEAVLEDLRAVRPELVVVNGDLIHRGPTNRAVLERVWEAPFRFTLGNHDDLVRRWAQRDPALAADHPLAASLAWTAAQLEAAHLAWIEGLPFGVELEALGVRIHHGSPRHYREGYGPHLEAAALAEIARAYPARVLVGSHTHKPFVLEHGGTLILNTGAVGAPFNADPRAQYLLLEITPDAVRFEHRRIPYDREAALRAFHTSGFLAEVGLVAEIFYTELRTARSHLVPFLLWLEREGRAFGPEAWRAYRHAAPERFGPVG